MHLALGSAITQRRFDSFVFQPVRGTPMRLAQLDLGLPQRLLLISADGGFHGVVDAALGAVGRARRVAVSVQNYALAPIILASSDCVCTMPRRLFSRFAGDLEFFDPPVALRPTPVLALWHPTSQEDQGHAWLRERLYAAADQA